MTDRPENPEADAYASGPRHARTDEPAPGPRDDVPPEVAAIEAHIERTREDLAQTVDQLAAKLDVKSRARARATQTRVAAVQRLQGVRDAATGADGRPAPAVWAATGGVLAATAAVVTVLLWRRNHATPAAHRRAARRAARRVRRHR